MSAWRPTRVRYTGVDKDTFTTEVIICFLDAENKKIELAVPKEQVEEIWDDLEDLVLANDAEED